MPDFQCSDHQNIVTTNQIFSTDPLIYAQFSLMGCAVWNKGKRILFFFSFLEAKGGSWMKSKGKQGSGKLKGLSLSHILSFSIK